MRSICLSGLAMLMACAPVPAFADMSGPLSAGGWMSWLGVDQLSDTLRQHEDNQSDAEQQPAPDPHPQIVINPSPAALRFVPSPTRRKANLAALVTKSRAQDPATAQQMEAMFASGDIIARLGKELVPLDLRVDDLADAYAVWWLNSWSAVHSDFGTPDRATVGAVKAQAKRAMLASGKAAAASDALKQEFAETLLIQALLVEAALQQAKGDPARLKALSEATNQGAQTMGLDLTRMTLTPNGFTPIG